MATDHDKTGNVFSNKDIHLTKQDLHENEDIHDSPKDESALQDESFVIDMPDVSDIPGQEHVQVPRMKEMADVTASSAGEEGEGIFDDDDEEEDEDATDNDGNVSAEEVALLERADEDMPGDDDEGLRNAELDKTDDDGDLLNEGSSATDISGGDLDLAGTEDDDDLEEIGEEDEENNVFSLDNDEADDDTEGTP